MADTDGEPVAILLGEDEHFLIPTLRAAKAVSRRFGGYTAAFQAVIAFDFEAVVAIVAAGLDKREPSDIRVIEEAVFANGLVALIDPVTRFVERLSNGGRDRPAEDDGASKKP